MEEKMSQTTLLYSKLKFISSSKRTLDIFYNHTAIK